MDAVSTVHGVMLEINGQGLLITGPAGIGKSELGLALVSMGHRLVADDLVELRRRGKALIAVRDPLFAGFVTLRDLGVVNLLKTHGKAAGTDQQRLDLILQLEPVVAGIENRRLDPGGRRDSQRILEVEVPRLRLTCSPNRPLARLAETAVREQQLRSRGYRGDLDFINRQRQRMEDGVRWN